MAAFPVVAVEVARTTEGGPPLTLHFPDSGTTLKRGQAVSLNSSGQIIAAAFGGSATNVLGFLAEDAPNVAGTLTKVLVATPHTTYVGNLTTSKTTTTLPQMVGKAVDMQTTSTNFTTLVDTTVGPQAIIVGTDSRDASTAGGDTNLRVHFIILGSKNVWQVGR